ncbi:hypothetical protein SU69_04055 [Thermosipho melanesiensis]|uniref:Uncharacterized protein n=2 Tax=Thermosipho melanesiensis TaxID=46541 RepID=A6LL53_THEM4|nr:hypothetical protein [Thermosipho melanesiensis]ABR30654.1 hypothetical protein Tmel_0792 [Thermosipho melanesiensis BI429]APT74853.1 hypothetical protein BW47_04275 [Thermosipho melanesiensis]OOC35728.1 hypothetical protein SU68_04110 [Thermosipho melanesiensis]OOC39027.1 hypothetical protein SU69_04055 [Thermosipho melanesiensis]OOC39175.1 hypothetical protein SU70_04055 [Thermosipho melanesiensis]
MKLQTRFFRTFLIYNLVVVVSLSIFFIIMLINNTNSGEKENLNLLTKRFTGCTVLRFFENFDDLIMPLLETNDVSLLFIGNNLFQNFVYEEVRNEIKKIKSKFDFLESIALKKGDKVFYFEKKFNLEEMFVSGKNSLKMIYKIKSKNVELFAQINFVKIFEEFLENEGAKNVGFLNKLQ